MATQADKERIISNINAITSRAVESIEAVSSIIMRSGFDDTDALTYSELYLKGEVFQNG